MLAVGLSLHERIGGIGTIWKQKNLAEIACNIEDSVSR